MHDHRALGPPPPARPPTLLPRDVLTLRGAVIDTGGATANLRCDGDALRRGPHQGRLAARGRQATCWRVLPWAGIICG
jgi:hypothetical protein